MLAAVWLVGLTNLDRLFGLSIGFASNIVPHEFADDLRGRPILRMADFQELITKRFFHADSESRIFPRHAGSVANGYTFWKGNFAFGMVGFW